MFDQSSVTSTHIDLKFTKTPKYASITDDKFRVFQTDVAPEVELTGVFKPINLSEDYNSLTRVLRLRFATAHEGTHTYRLQVSGIVDVASRDMGTGLLDFTRGPTVVTDPTYPVPQDEINEGVVVKNKSIIADAFSHVTTSTQTLGKNFYLVKTDPEEDELFIGESHERGRITLTFSSRPAVQFLTTEYFRMQRKKLGTTSRWEKIAIRIALDSARSKVYVYMPSLDTPPVYNSEGHLYFEPGYKYRLKISREVSANG